MRRSNGPTCIVLNERLHLGQIVWSAELSGESKGASKEQSNYSSHQQLILLTNDVYYTHHRHAGLVILKL